MMEADIPEIFVAQQQGMKSTNSLSSYKTPGSKHMIMISDAIEESSSHTATESSTSHTATESSTSSITTARPTNSVTPAASDPDSPILISSQKSKTTSTTSHFQGATFNNCTFNMYGSGIAIPTIPPPQNARSAEPIEEASPPRKRRFRFGVLDSDEE